MENSDFYVASKACPWCLDAPVLKASSLEIFLSCIYTGKNVLNGYLITFLLISSLGISCNVFWPYVIYFDCIYPKLLPYPCLLFLNKLIRCSCYWQYLLRCVAFHWDVANILEDKSLRKSHSSYPEAINFFSYGYGFVPNFLFHARILSGSTLCRSYAVTIIVNSNMLLPW